MSASSSDLPVSHERFVSADWLASHLNDSSITIIDARMLPPGNSTRDIHAEYRAGHLPSAVFFDIETLSDHSTDLPHMMPTREDFARAMGELGIDNQQHLVIYDEGNLFSAPRAWWMLHTFGATSISILSGGLAGWKAQNLPLEQGDVTPKPTTFHATLDENAIRSRDDVLSISWDKSEQIVDARPAPRFNAEVDEPRPGLHRGRIPGSLNVPWTDLVSNGALKPNAELATILHKHGVDFTRPIVASCGSGVTASVVVLALTQLNVPNVTLYDGSWSDWGSRDDVPIERD
ncbi:3-mercaptopyruvate sulfurtransferase [Pectobacterium brasiliense]|uniref:3-mercaptopyruvate sulfurtransferase n=1 Tax=Pectobacterium brasiliense TaxID=180957 RepID=A0AAE2WE21_9GAMM|nr:3-mercaptopyruvate sulfurtransferase [Pectobacterium brasiliense]MBA0216837.1 3-mercaptopyruvate sulfurtransferase [Pectobacterium brasiliense]MBN3050897.1 3-mercaptopyruvate sulfurtransferase [Pectobacterium brasiliense]MBN3072225.1 3-mercaptopyruvate sulfurtransferase [Pectobacterium brasiliense]MBN3168113.1 3-mercaptopyruvate sulfurtransferase [Pectobacterium brasiliense]